MIIKRRFLRGILAGLAVSLSTPYEVLFSQELNPKADDNSARKVKAAFASIPFAHIETSGRNALIEWYKLQAGGRGWPIIIGGDEDLVEFADQLASEVDASATRSILEKAAALKHPQSLKAEREREAKSADSPSEEVDSESLTGSWPIVAPESPLLSIVHDRHGRYLDRVHILIIPAADGAEVPAVLHWGGWNACPLPEFHVAALRSWKDRFGAKLIGLNSDTMILRVDRHPQTRQAALDLAKEHYIYCEDVVLQGTETLSALAASLMKDNWWYFWWD